jgi:hypothetical protein
LLAELLEIFDVEVELQERNAHEVVDLRIIPVIVQGPEQPIAHYIHSRQRDQPLKETRGSYHALTESKSHDLFKNFFN